MPFLETRLEYITPREVLDEFGLHLINCPFCASDNVALDPGWPQVKCLGCGCTGPSGYLDWGAEGPSRKDMQRSGSMSGRARRLSWKRDCSLMEDDG